MKVEISKEVFKKFHKNFMVGLIICQNINNTGESTEIYKLTEEISQFIRLNFNLETLKTHDLISSWETVIEEFGPAARHYQSSVERMMRQILQNKKIKSENKLIDLCHYLSLKHIIPLGYNDSDKLTSGLKFALAQGTEKFTDPELKPPKKGELILLDKTRLLAKKLDYRQSKRTKPTPKTKKAIIHIEALPPLKEKKLLKILKELSQLIQSFCQGKTKTAILNSKNPRIKI